MTHDSRLTTICWDVDTQFDFIMPSGKLAVPGADAIVPNLQALTEWAHRTSTRIVATADDHDIGHAEITDTPDWKTTFPPHCMRGTAGQLKIPATQLQHTLLFQPVALNAGDVAAVVKRHHGDVLLNKPGTDVFRWNPNSVTVLDALAPERIIVYGVATDFCTRAAVEGLARHCPDAALLIVSDAIRGIDEAASRALVSAWRDQGHTIVTTRDVVT